MTSVQYKSNIILLQGGELMDERNNDFDFDFMPIGQAIKSQRNDQGAACRDHWICSTTHSVH